MSDKSMTLGGGGNSFPFEAYGDTVTGRIVDFTETQQTDIDTGAPLVWDDGRAKMQLVVELQTSLRDDAADDGIRSVYLRGSKKAETMSTLAAVSGAIKEATGGNAIQVGATLTLTYVSERPVPGKKYKAKCYTAAYTPKSANVVADNPAPAAAPVEAPAPAANTLTPEQIAALVAANAPAAAPVDPIAAHPQGAALRAAGVPDDVIKSSLGL